MKFENFSHWKKRLSKNNVKILDLKKKGQINRKLKKSLLYDVKLKLHKTSIIRSISIENDGIAIIPLINVNGKYYTLLVEQFRICNGKYILEFPSGSNEKNKNIKKQCSQEIFEELSLKIKNKEFVKINDKPMPLISSSNSSMVTYFYFIKKMQFKNLLKLNNLVTGEHKDKEFIKVKVFELKRLKNFANNANLIIGLFLLSKLKFLKRHLN